ncbi:MAG: M48 family metallopeptidase [Acidaminococcaceae bacterium]|nr:M48 family metallopeptidase [Acidaminococcaceae bacterium]
MRRRQSAIETYRLGEIEYLLQYKRIRRMYLRFKMPEAKPFVTAPFSTPLSEVEQFITVNLEWIRKQQRRQEQLALQPVRRYVSGETVYVWGAAYELLVLTDAEMARQLCGLEAAALLQRGRAFVRTENRKLILACPAAFDAVQREECLDQWLKRQVEAFLPVVFQGCGSIVGKRETSWYVRKMKTRWGTCNIRTGRICINLTLGRLPPEFLSYIVTHELTHLWEKGHGEKFRERMDLYYPQWKERRKEIMKLSYMI